MNIGHRNWLAVGRALVPLCLDLRKYAEREMKKLHALITTSATVRVPTGENQNLVDQPTLMDNQEHVAFGLEN